MVVQKTTTDSPVPGLVYIVDINVRDIVIKGCLYIGLMLIEINKKNIQLTHLISILKEGFFVGLKYKRGV